MRLSGSEQVSAPRLHPAAIIVLLSLLKHRACETARACCRSCGNVKDGATRWAAGIGGANRCPATGPGGSASFRGIVADFGFVRSGPGVLSIDPLAELAEAQEQLRGRLMELAPVDTEELRAAWQAAAEGVLKEEKERKSFDSFPEQFLLLVTCRDERHQVELLQRFHDQSIQVKALIA